MVGDARASAAADVVIVGAGAAGCLAAAKLAAAGKRVVVLEAGPAWTLQDMKSSQIWARRLKWGGAPVRVEGDQPFGHNMATGWGVGGAALHHYANWPRLTPDDFRLKSRFGRGADWPLSYEELRPYYDRIQAEVGLAGEAEAEVWRPPGAPYPHPPVPTFLQAQTLAKGFEKRGWRTAPPPFAVLTEARGDRQPCIYDGWCDAGCPIGSLANPLVTYHRDAVRAGATFHAWSPVTAVLSQAGRVTGVAYVEEVSGERRRIAAEVVILAASAIQTPRLLLASATPGNPAGLANASGLVGRGFMAHALLNVFGVFKAAMDNHVGLTGGNLVCRDGREKTAAPGGFGGREWVLGPALKPNDLIGIAMTRPDLFGRALDRFLRDEGPRLGSMGALCETLPRPDNRVDLLPETDSHGVPLARVTHSLGPETRALLDHVRREGEDLMRAAGASAVWSSPVITNHALGSVRMGSDPSTSVTDSYGRAWDAPNLFVMGGALFPTIGAAGPTFTIHALTLRAVDNLLASWGQG